MGDDALACLKDIKRWLKLYDQKTNRLDVARCLAEANLVNGDLLAILAEWPEEATEDRIKSKISLACCMVSPSSSNPMTANDESSSGVTCAINMADREKRASNDGESP